MLTRQSVLPTLQAIQAWPPQPWLYYITTRCVTLAAAYPFIHPPPSLPSIYQINKTVFIHRLSAPLRSWTGPDETGQSERREGHPSYGAPPHQATPRHAPPAAPTYLEQMNLLPLGYSPLHMLPRVSFSSRDTGTSNTYTLVPPGPPGHTYPRVYP